LVVGSVIKFTQKTQILAQISPNYATRTNPKLCTLYVFETAEQKENRLRRRREHDGLRENGRPLKKRY